MWICKCAGDFDVQLRGYANSRISIIDKERLFQLCEVLFAHPHIKSLQIINLPITLQFPCI